MEEQAAVDRRREQEKEEAKNREREREEQWYSKKLEMEMEMANKRTEEGRARLQSVKLQKYTITPFKGRLQRLASILEPVHHRGRQAQYSRHQ